MPTLTETITKDIVTAMKAHDDVRLRTLRMLKASFQNAAIEARLEALDDEATVAVVKREAKKRREAAAAFSAGGREDLAAGELAELAVLTAYLPPEMPEAEVRVALERVVAGLPAGTPFGSVMKAAMAELKGRADAALVSRIAKELAGS